jgi:glycosyltransferase involved in cell wall biosynthesis
MYNLKLFTGRTVLFILYFLIRIFSLLPTKKQKNKDNIVVLTGTFHSKNWIDAHLVPLVTCSSVKHVYIVSNNMNYDVKGLTVITPRSALSRLIGATSARLVTFLICSLKNRPDYIGGFHILFNGTLAILFANILRCRSIYFSGGGITETLNSGKTENNFFKFLNGRDEFLTSTICKIISNATAVITMGKGAKLFFTANGIENNNIHVISGAIDENKFFPINDNREKIYDLVLTARLSKVKQVNLLLDILANLKIQNIQCNTLIIGDGPLLNDLKAYAESLGVCSMVNFVGHQDDVLNWLQQSKVYILTSQSEGLSLSMLEGLKVGLPAIVPNVGDLSDVLIDGYNGFLIDNHNIEDFVLKIIELLDSPEKLTNYSHNAIESTKRFDLKCVQQQWSVVFK